jgi:uncharacterized membrane protein/protein-disulfide isomerase
MFAIMTHLLPSMPPVFSVPVRWTLRVLAWLAFFLSAYLAWSAVTNSSIIGCGMGSESGCDHVLGSKWSLWFKVVPVAVAGLGCYAMLAALSVLLGLQNRATRWIITAFVALSLAAAGASVWFLALQAFAIGHFCLYCVPTDLCGIALGAIATFFTVRWLKETEYLRRLPVASSGIAALRGAIPVAGRAAAPLVSRAAPIMASQSPRSVASCPAPSLSIAAAGAAGMIVLLIGGQLLFPAATFNVQKVALTDSVDLNDAAKERIAMRIPTESLSSSNPQPNDNEQHAADGAPTADNPGEVQAGASDAATESKPTETAPTVPQKSRLLKFLGGKLTLDTYKHPIIGSPEAPHVVVELASYDCSHCRKMHPKIQKALERYGDQVAMLVLVVPLEQKCNKLVTNSAASHQGACKTAQLAVGIASAKPTAFVKFHEWLMANEEKPPRPEEIVPKAYGIVDAQRLRDLNKDGELDKQVEGYIDLFDRLVKQSRKKDFGLPVQILGDHIMSGSVEKEEDVFKAWEDNLGIKPEST